MELLKDWIATNCRFANEAKLAIPKNNIPPPRYEHPDDIDDMASRELNVSFDDINWAKKDWHSHWSSVRANDGDDPTSRFQNANRILRYLSENSSFQGPIYRGIAFKDKASLDAYLNPIISAGYIQMKRLESFTWDENMASKFSSSLSAAVIPGNGITANGIVLEIKPNPKYSGVRGCELMKGSEMEVVPPIGTIYKLIGSKKEKFGNFEQVRLIFEEQ